MKLVPDGIAPDPAKVQGIMDLRLPDSWYDLARFVGMVVGHNDSVPNPSGISQPLREHLKQRKQGVKFVCNKATETAWVSCQHAIADAALKEHDGPGDIEMYVDWSKPAISGHIVRIHKGRRHILEYASKALTGPEHRHSTPLGELYALWWLAVKWRHFLRGRNARAYTDHRTLKGLTLKKLEGIWATFILDLAEIGVDVRTIPGKRNIISDAIGRLFKPRSAPLDVGLPDGPTPVNPLDDSAIIRLDDLADRRAAFIECNCGPVGGHFSLPNTLKWMRVRYSWRDMEKDVTEWWNACDWCQRNGRGRVTKVALRSMVPSEPWELVGIDIVGPVKVSGVDWYFFAGVDAFSKTFVAGAMKPTTDDLIKNFEQRIIWMYDTPKVVVSDRGTQMMAKKWHDFCEANGIQFYPTVSDHQSANGQVERMIQTFKKVLASKLAVGVPFKLALKMSVATMNKVLVSASNRVTAHEVLYGTRWKGATERRVVARWEKTLAGRETALNNSVNAKTTQALRHDKGTRPRSLSVGDWVLVWNPARKRFGPFEVLLKLKNDGYVLFDSIHQKYKPFHISQLSDPYIPGVEALESDADSILSRYLAPSGSGELPRNLPSGDSDYFPATGHRFAPPTPSKPVLNVLLQSPSHAAYSDMPSTPAKPTSSPSRPSSPKRLEVGNRIEVYWDDKAASKAGCTPGWYPGEIVQCFARSRTGTHAVQYDDDTMRGTGPIREFLTPTVSSDKTELWRFADSSPSGT